MERLAPFFEDDKLLFIPLQNEELDARLAKYQKDYKKRYHTQEISMFKKMINPLLIRSVAEETRLRSVL